MILFQIYFYICFYLISIAFVNCGVLSFNGRTQWLNLGEITFGTQFTIMMWWDFNANLCPNSFVRNDNFFLSKLRSSNNAQLFLFYTKDLQIGVRTFPGVNGFVRQPPLVNERLMHLSIVVNETLVTTFVDGKLNYQAVLSRELTDQLVPYENFYKNVSLGFINDSKILILIIL